MTQIVDTVLIKTKMKIDLNLYGYKITNIHDVVDAFIYDNIKLHSGELSILTGINPKTKTIVTDILHNYNLSYTECVYNPSILKIYI